jgi:hypothetical protein
MEKKLPNIRISDLTKLDELELRKQLGPEIVKFEEDIENQDEHGEIATITAVVIISLAALRVLAIHLVKAHNRKRFKKRVEVDDGKGNRRVVEIEYTASSDEAPEAEVLKQLKAACNVDASGLAKV